MLQTLSHKHLSLPFIWVEDQCISYQDLVENTQTLIDHFTAQGIKKNDRIAFIAEKSPASIFIFFALLEMGVSICLLSTRIPEESIPFYLDLARVSCTLNPDTLSIQRRCKGEDLDPSILLFTSGSQGTPKLVSLKPIHFIESAKSSLERLRLKEEKGCWLLSLPLFHVSGLSILFRCFLSQSSVAFTSDLLQGHPLVTHLSLVPTQLLKILDKTHIFPKLKCALIGGAPISEHLIRMSLKKNIPIYLTYGMTETASQITMTDYKDTLLPPHLGKPLPGKDVKISDEGEILVKGNSLFLGYDTKEGLKKPFLEDSWFATGDLGKWNLEGNLEHLGRKDNLFISGGENIHPEMIEKALEKIPGVFSALVVPLEDPEFGERPVAFVEMDILLEKEIFYIHLKPLLPKFCLPLYFLPFPEESAQNLKWKRSELKILAKKILLQKV